MAVLCAAPAAGQDHSEPIPHGVGAPGGVSFRVNPAVPSGMDAARFLAVVERSLRRWGNEPAGATAATPGAVDTVDVVGMGDLAGSTIGLAQFAGTTSTETVPSWRDCRPTGQSVPQERLAVSYSTVALRLRRDVVRRGRVRKRTKTHRVRRARHSVVASSPAPVMRCRSQSGVQRARTTVEVDVVIDQGVGSNWAMGPGPPSSGQLDFETNLLHELGHVSGLKHQHDRCDPSAPMGVSQSSGDWWRAPDDWQRPSCAESRAPPATAGSDPTGSVGPGLGGRAFSVSAGVRAGYDAQRFTAVAQRSIERAGGSFAGRTSAPPEPGDGITTVGFRTLPPGIYSEWRQSTIDVTVERPRGGTCVGATAREPQVHVRKRTRRVGRRRVRADVLAVRTVTIPSARCTAIAAQTTAEPDETEYDLAVNDRAHAWEFGPAHPRTGTRFDLEGALLQLFVQVAGAGPASGCDRASANAPLGPGDWWRSATDLRRPACPEPTRSAAGVNRSAAAAPGPGGTSIVRIADQRSSAR